jgi:DNA-binding CsgD family transcriptional regulator
LGRKQRPLGAIAGSDAPHPASDEDMGVDLFSDSGTRLQAYVIRNPPLFSAADRTLFTMLIPHLRSLLTLLAPPCPPEESPGPAQLSGLGLTPREREVLYWISEGKTNAEAAEILGIAAGTVRVHLEHIYPKLGVENRHGASRRAIEELHPARYLTPAGLRARSG